MLKRPPLLTVGKQILTYSVKYFATKLQKMRPQSMNLESRKLKIDWKMSKCKINLDNLIACACIFIQYG